MSILSASTRAGGIVTIQCDVCAPPAIVTNERDEIARAGWHLATSDDGRDVCPWCQWLERHGRAAPRFAPVDGHGGRVPDLLIIGAAKAGTTSLHYYLDTHPDIAMAEFKELRFFQDPRCREWMGRYRQSFDPSAKLVGESSTMYTRSPTLPGVAERIAALAPMAKLIYLVRDPVERAIASYHEETFQGLETRAVERAFADLDDPMNPYLAASRYGEQLSAYLEHFPSSSIRVVSMTDLGERPADVLADLADFLGVDADFEIGTFHRHNAAEVKYGYPPLARRIRDSSLGRFFRLMAPEVRDRFAPLARRVFRTPLAPPEISVELRAAIAARLAPDAARFRAMTGRPFEDWSI